ncbi:hypothetical protein SPRG_05524 [Saprolegnia parasitica CBS 223.65]|uniref:Transmembrane protein n=1 Tax=Saprolegnia parasitica (strain CBS 223.65) TaxID=695850 RepID=A0A067CFP1_SAPPC|nr:hypothetical protein SPRG_05524 [Saprolegnia parasitica CBS 223.65]KDO29569.1 hypothetical protein SPRG_05524 [Saprolegnia parasitica CBS 223.65]|eukprot:XP_012199633.1 hypothetical protein SPRG_05524 [Saprolegnia parasitica CBS 223.65]
MATTVSLKGVDWARLVDRARARILPLVSVLIFVSMGVDLVVNNWAINDLLGNGYFFATPVASVRYAKDLALTYAFPKGRAPADLSNVGQLLANTTVRGLGCKSEQMYVISAGDYPLTNATSLCATFQKTYINVAVSSALTTRLATTTETVTFYRGNAVSHAFTDDATANLATRAMKSSELVDLGYIPGRSAVDMRFTREFVLANSSLPQTQSISYFRLFPRNFCSACDPVAELGFGACNMTFVYNATAKTIVVSSSTFIDGSTYTLGLIQPRNAFTTLALYARCLAIFIALSGYIASRLTVHWRDVDLTKTEGVVSHVLRVISPKLFPYQSDALTPDMFCFNSDLFVFLYSISIVLDTQNCFIFVRNVNVYNNLAPQAAPSIQMFFLSLRFLWLNCAVLKLLKIFWNLLGTVAFTGHSNVIEWLNWSSVVSVYVSAIVLVYIPQFIEYSNNTFIELQGHAESLDGIRIEMFDSFYVRCASSLAVGLIVNLVLVTALDHGLNHKRWKLLKKHTLARQAVYNSSSILCDFFSDVQEDDSIVADPTMTLSARRLCTLQWFFSTHLTCFGLPEKKLRAKKQTVIQVQTKSAPSTASSAMTNSRSVVMSEAAAAALLAGFKAGKDDPRNATYYLVVQDGEANVHLLDGALSDIQSISIHAKVASNANLTIK